MDNGEIIQIRELVISIKRFLRISITISLKRETQREPSRSRTHLNIEDSLESRDTLSRETLKEFSQSMDLSINAMEIF